MQAPPGWEDILDPGEAILWQGRPLPVFDWPALLRDKLVSRLFFVVFAVAWLSGALHMTLNDSDPTPLSLLFPLLGLIILFKALDAFLGPVLRDWLRLRGSHYTLTDHHAFIATRILGQRKLTRLPLGPGLIPALEDGDPGSVWLSQGEDPRAGWTARGAGGTYHGLAAGPGRRGFERIREARRVYRLILDTQAALPAPSAPHAVSDASATAALTAPPPAPSAPDMP